MAKKKKRGRPKKVITAVPVRVYLQPATLKRIDKCANVFGYSRSGYVAALIEGKLPTWDSKEK